VKKLKLYLLSTIVLFSLSCGKENPTDLPEDGLSLELDFSNLDFKMTNQFDLNKVSIDEIIELTVNELYSKEFDNNIMSKNQHSKDYYVDGFDINIKGDIVTLNPINDPVVNDACGSGNGWKKYATCYSESCVKSEMEKAGKDLSDKLKSGEFMDIRVKRNSINAIVCGRLIAC